MTHVMPLYRINMPLLMTYLKEQFSGRLAFDAKAKGGTGSCFNWQLIPEQCTLPIILAGGLKPKNVRAAIQEVRPYALDVSSGVESEKGIKDTQKIAALIKEVNAGDKSN